MKFDKLYKFFLISSVVIVVDQLVKLWVYKSLGPGEHSVAPVFGDWFKLNYTTNPGMAFGIQLGGDYGKIILSLFRLAAIVFIGLYMKKLFLRQAPTGLVICIAFILGGAVGNLVDSAFYAYFDPEELMVTGAPFKLFHGKVIDMFFFDIAEGYYPEGWPLVGGDYYHYWPIFNIADAAIFCSVIVIFLRQKRFFKKPEEESEVAPSNSSAVDS